MKKLFLLVLLIFLGTSCLKGKPEFVSSNIDRATTDEQKGAIYFLQSDFGALRQHGMKSNILPFKIANAAILMMKGHDPDKENSRRALNRMYRSYGLLVDANVANLPLGTTMKKSEYLGLFKGKLSSARSKHVPRLETEGSGFSCVACHGGLSYDPTGKPLVNKVYLGVPNTSLNIEKYTNDVYKGFLKIVDKKKEFLSYLKKVFPEMSKREYRTVKMIFKKEIVKKVLSLKKNLDRQSPASNGGAGLTNGVAALKFQLGLISNKHNEENETGFTSIPAIFDRNFRSSLLYDGLYEPLVFVDNKDLANSTEHIDQLARITTFFTVPSSANKISVAQHHFDKSKKIFQYLKTAKRPKFPGRIDYNIAKHGEKIFLNKCSSCHGVYSSLDNNLTPKLVSFPNKFVEYSEIGTDASRLDVIDNQLVETINDSLMGKYLNAVKRDGYIAPILTNLWITAPYLHNGSVPTLWGMMNPDQRPKKFLVGGHALDMNKVGVLSTVSNVDKSSTYKNNYIPWASPEMYNTELEGRSNKGHEKPFDLMTRKEKLDLIEYLKTI